MSRNPGAGSQRPRSVGDNRGFLLHSPFRLFAAHIPPDHRRYPQTGLGKEEVVGLMGKTFAPVKMMEFYSLLFSLFTLLTLVLFAKLSSSKTKVIVGCPLASLKRNHCPKGGLEVPITTVEDIAVGSPWLSSKPVTLRLLQPTWRKAQTHCQRRMSPPLFTVSHRGQATRPSQHHLQLSFLSPRDDASPWC